MHEILAANCIARSAVRPLLSERERGEVQHLQRAGRVEIVVDAFEELTLVLARLVDARGIPDDLREHAVRAVAECPRAALHLVPIDEPGARQRPDDAD